MSIRNVVLEPYITQQSVFLLGSDLFVTELKDYIELIFGTKLANLYRQVLCEALGYEIYEVLNTESLSEEDLSIYTLGFWRRLVSLDIVTESLNVIKSLLRSDKTEFRAIYSRVLDVLTRRIGESKYDYSEHVVQVLSALLDKDLWVFDRCRIFGLEGLISRLIGRACCESLEFVNTMIMLAFATMSILAALFGYVRYRVENLDRLVSWSVELAEVLNNCMSVLDSKLMEEIDPESETKEYLEDAEYFYQEAERLIKTAEQIDGRSRRLYIVQACEKLYKTVENCVKALAARYGLRSVIQRPREAVHELSQRLKEESSELCQRLGDLVINVWDTAYFLHVQGFHEMKLKIEAVKARLPKIEQFFKTAKDLVEKQSTH